MFRRHHTESAVMSSTPVRVRTVRVLADDEELLAAVERARAFERRVINEQKRRNGTYDRLLRDVESDSANAVAVESREQAPFREGEGEGPL